MFNKFFNNFIFSAFIIAFCVSPALCVTPSEQAEPESRYPDFAKEYIGQDKFEKFNRKMFNFNAKLNKFALRPMHVVWASIMPKYGMDRIQSAYDNIEYPKRLVSCLLQKDFKGSGRETLRFLTNSTLGIGGMFDPAKKIFKLEPLQEDIEQALCKCKVKSGPYLVLPVISSTTPRGVAGRIIETGLDPTTYVAAPVAALVKFGLFLNRTSLLQPLNILLERTFADPYDIAKKIYGMERYIRLSNLDRKEVLDAEAKLIDEVTVNSNQNLLASNENAGAILSSDKININTLGVHGEINTIKDDYKLSDNENNVASNEPLKGGTYTDEKILQEAVQNSLDLKPDIILPDYNPQSPVVDSMRTALFDLPGIDNSIWSEISIWNRSFSKRIKSASIPLYPDRQELKFRYIMQKDKSSPVVILYPSIGEGVMSHHSVVLAKLFYDAGYSAIIQGSHFHFDFLKTMPEGYRPGLPREDAAQLKLATRKILEFLENKYDTKFRKKVLLGTSFGAVTTLFVAESESQKNTLNINKFISINPPIELMFALKELDKNNDEWNKNPGNLKHKTAVTTAKILDLFNQKGENKDFKIESLPFSDYEGKLITGFILRQKLSDLVFTIENSKNTDKKELYNSINNMSYKDYAQKYLIKDLKQDIDVLAHSTSLHSISDYLKNNNNYKIYHTMDDYFVNQPQLKKLRDYTGKNTVLISNGGHLGFLYRQEFLDHFKNEIKLEENLAMNLN